MVSVPSVAKINENSSAAAAAAAAAAAQCGGRRGDCRGCGGSDFGSAAAAWKKKIWNFMKNLKNEKIAKKLEKIKKKH